MTVVSLTSVPPRFAGLGPVLASLLAQGAETVVLSLPRRFDRFPGAFDAPALPDGVELLWSDEDFGPATKLIPAQRAFPGRQIAICDDDCLYGPGWLTALQAASDPGMAVTGSAFPVSRLKRQGGRVAQGFAGVLVPATFECPPPPAPCRDADDLWLSAQLDRAGVEIVESPDARMRVRPLSAPKPLQDDARPETYALAAAHIHAVLGIWPPMHDA